MTLRTLSPTIARRLAITRQQLAGPRPAADAAGIMEVTRALGCLQLDPISVVARSHQLVLWSRLGAYDLAELDRVMWQERRLFEYWAHCASIVLTEDYSLFSRRMRRYPGKDGPWSDRVRQWRQDNAPLRRLILSEIRRRGPLPSRYFEEKGIQTQHWVSTGWTSGRNISRMLDFLWMQGKIMVAGRAGIQKLWDLSERCLPDWTPRELLSEREIGLRAAQRSLRALGVAPLRHIDRHFTRGRYPDLAGTLAELERAQKIERVQVQNGKEAWPGTWYIHTDDLPLLERLERGEWAPRTTLLSPFDNLICDRQRTQLLFDFKYTIEIYTPSARRQYGYYVLPILHGDRLIGRLDPVMDRANARLVVNAIHAEPDAPRTPETGRAIADSLQELARFLGARDIVYPRRMPTTWRVR
ncbi:MAG: crosslink repair DNA glycosylase YcaQ family protein [Anaerolineae bacterium]